LRLHPPAVALRSRRAQGGTGGGGADRNDSLLDPTLDPDTTWGDMSEGTRRYHTACPRLSRLP